MSGTESVGQDGLAGDGGVGLGAGEARKWRKTQTDRRWKERGRDRKSAEREIQEIDDHGTGVSRERGRANLMRAT